MQPNELQILDPALISITQESIQHNVFLDDSKEQIDAASDAGDALPASVVTSEAPPFPDLGPYLISDRLSSLEFHLNLQNYPWPLVRRQLKSSPQRGDR